MTWALQKMYYMQVVECNTLNERSFHCVCCFTGSIDDCCGYSKCRHSDIVSIVCYSFHFFLQKSDNLYKYNEVGQDYLCIYLYWPLLCLYLHHQTTAMSEKEWVFFSNQLFSGVSSVRGSHFSQVSTDSLISLVGESFCVNLITFVFPLRKIMRLLTMTLSS